MDDQTTSLEIDPQLKSRLSALAIKAGRTLPELAETVLRSHAEWQERQIAEQDDDEQRWQCYLETGQSVSLEQVRGKLAAHALKAAPQ